MVAQKERQHAIDYITKLLEDSGHYTFEQKTDFGLLLKEKIIERTPQHIEVIIPNGAGTVNDLLQHCYNNTSKKIFTVPIFYKDGKTAFVRMVERNKSWRNDKSLKQYTVQQINEMLHLRSIEKKILNLNNLNSEVAYFQPQTERLEESLRIFRLKPIVLDYSHIPPEDSRTPFVHNRESIDYKLPRDLGNIKPAGIVSLIYQPHFIGKLVSAPLKIGLDFSIDVQSVEEEIADNAQRAYPQLDQRDALNAYLNED